MSDSLRGLIPDATRCLQLDLVVGGVVVHLAHEDHPVVAHHVDQLALGHLAPGGHVDDAHGRGVLLHPPDPEREGAQGLRQEVVGLRRGEDAAVESSR